MATPTTTIETVRESLEAAVVALTPTQSPKLRFERSRYEGSFRDWAEANPDAAARRFSLLQSGPAERGEITTQSVDEFLFSLEFLSAYPHRFGMYEGAGLENLQDLHDMIEEDAEQLRKNIGLAGHSNWPAGSWPTGDGWEREEGDGVTFLVLRIEGRYYRST